MTVKIDVLDYMDDVHALEFVRLLHEFKDENGVVQLIAPVQLIRLRRQRNNDAAKRCWAERIQLLQGLPEVA